MKKLLVLLTIFIIFIMSSCDNGDSTVLTEYSDFNKLFTTAAKEVAPTFNTTRATWNSGSPIYELYGVFNVDGTNVGYFNLYDALEDADGFFENISDNGESIEATTITPPYSIGDDTITYDTKYQYSSDTNKVQVYAKVDGDKVNMYMIGYNTPTTGEKIKSEVQGEYDQGTHDLVLNMLMGNYVTANSANTWEIVRVNITGNTETHAFKLKIIRDGSGYDHNIVAKGVSEGFANYYLIKLAESNGSDEALDFASPKYYKISGDSIVSDLQSLSDDGFATVTSAEDPKEYKDDLSGHYETSDIPKTTDMDGLDFSFTGSTTVPLDGSSEG